MPAAMRCADRDVTGATVSAPVRTPAPGSCAGAAGVSEGAGGAVEGSGVCAGTVSVEVGRSEGSAVGDGVAGGSAVAEGVGVAVAGGVDVGVGSDDVVDVGSGCGAATAPDGVARSPTASVATRTPAIPRARRRTRHDDAA